MNTFLLKIVTPVSDFYSGEIDSLRIDTPDGKLGFLRGALPRVGIVKEGEIDISTEVLELKAFCGDGIYRADGDTVTLIVEHCAFEGETEELKRESGGLSVRSAKALIASTIKKMHDKTLDG